MALLTVAAVAVAVGLIALRAGDSTADQTQATTAVDTTSTVPRPVPSSSFTQAPTTVPETTTAVPETTTTTEPPPVRGTELFVSPDGVDHPDAGWTIDDPLQTPDFAVSVSLEGDTINLLPGIYGPMTISERSDLTVTAPFGDATLTSGSYDLYAGVLVENSTRIVIDGLRTEHLLWGLRVFNSSDVILRNNEVVDTGQEAIHVLHRSENVLIEGNRVDGTGRRPGGNGEFQFADFGEGIYLGTGGYLDNREVDDVSNVVISGNTVANTTAEAIEVKASVFDVVITGNTIHDVDVHSGAAISIGRGERIYDANVLVEQNTIWNVTVRNPWADGIGVRVSSPSTVRNNIIFGVEHFGIRVDDELRALDGEVVLDGNLIFDSGLEAFRDESSATGVPVTELGTISGQEAQSLLAELGQDPASLDVASLLEHLQSL